MFRVSPEGSSSQSVSGARVTGISGAREFWFDRVKSALAGGETGLVVSLPAYRPDLVAELASALDIKLIDFRNDVLQPLGWKAGKLSLEALTDRLHRLAREGGGVCQNAEALLATKTSKDRRLWFARFLETNWPAPVVLPIVLFRSDLAVRHDAITDLTADELPDESILLRLLETRW